MQTTKRRKAGRPKGSRTNSTAKVIAGTLGEDLLIGIEAIASFLGQPRRRVQHWADTRAIPLIKTGNLWTGSKSVLRLHFTGSNSETAA
jgi:hypothetical protein